MTHEAWDEFVEQSPQGSPFAASWWLDAAAGPGNWGVAQVLRNGSVVAGWPTVRRDSRHGTVHVGAPLTPHLGPILSPPPHDASSMRRWSHMVDQTRELVEKLGSFAHLEARCHPEFSYWTPLSWSGFSQTTSYTWRFNDLTDVEQILAGAHQRVRRWLKKSASKGIEVEPVEVDVLVELHQRTLSRHDVASHAAPVSVLDRVARAATDRGQAEVLAARDADGNVHAAGLFVYDSRSTWYVAGGSDERFRDAGGATALLWDAIKRSAARGTAFDFEGSMLPGVEPFFRSFGGEPTPWSTVRSTPSAAYSRSVSRRRVARRLLRRT